MKVQITADSKKVIHLDEQEIVRQIISDCKDDDLRAYVMSAVNCVGTSYNTCQRIYEMTAQIARNCRCWDAFFEGSRDLDVWIEAAALTSEGFVMIGAYLTDIWQICGREAEDAVVRSHFYIRRFVEQR